MDLTTVNLDAFLADPTSKEGFEEARKAAESLILTGALIVKDSRAPKESNDRFIDLFEDYFAQDKEVLEKDERPEWGYQVGVTLENTEKPKCGKDDECLKIISDLDASERPLDISGNGADPKCRFFHKMTVDPPYKSAFPHSEIPNVTPANFGETWEQRVAEWGGHMKDAVEGVSRMLAAGLGLNADTFVDAGKYGSHLLAPTATDLDRFGKADTIFAGFHSDLNFLTIHGQSRYPGLNIWARNSGKRMAVKIPPGCLLVQAGKQLEWASGGLIKAGFHEVICNTQTLERLQARKAEFPSRPSIRISSTFFWHLSPDYLLSPIPPLRKQAESRFGPQKDYGELLVGDQVKRYVFPFLFRRDSTYCVTPLDWWRFS